ncbi:MAG: phage integrase SAM-like domain-containing protein [Clostridiales bacterium]|jgi:site-specific recombinase XerD|nr:phage integrase SAM-like domain-containing protein [Clostridiales bacterium]
MYGEYESLFSFVRAYLKQCLPHERKFGENTIRPYKKALDLLFAFVKVQKNMPLSKVAFEMIDRNLLSEFLDHLEKQRNCSQKRAIIG